MGASEFADGIWAVPGFVLEAELGSGASGRVFAAVQQGSGYPVAIKFLAPRLVADEAFVARFRAEARMLAVLRDPNVIRFFEYVESPGTAAIVMELVDGATLGGLLAECGPTSPEAALTVLRGSLLGLAAAHRVGIIHRDYKPANILIRRDGTSLLTDFGVAAAGGSRVAAAGTPAYMAPEQWNGVVGAPSDVYAATAVFFECVTGHRPFGGGSLVELAAAHAAGRIPVEDVPGPLVPLVEHGLAKDPAARPLTAELFVAELEEIATASYGPDWAERGRDVLAALVAGTPVALALLGGGSTTGTATTTGGTTFAAGPVLMGVAAGAGAVLLVGGAVFAAVGLGSHTPRHVAQSVPHPPPTVAVATSPSTAVPSPTLTTSAGSSATSSAPALNPALSLTPGSVPVNGTYTASFTGFQGGEDIALACANNSGTVTARTSGSVSGKFSAGASPGRFSCTAVGQTSGARAAAGLTVTASYNPSLTLSPTTVTGGDTLTVTGSGFQPGEQIRYAQNPPGGFTAPKTTADASGGFSEQFTALSAPGVYTVTATGAGSGATASASFTVTVPALHPTLTTDPSEIPAHSQYTATVSGFQPGETVKFICDPGQDQYISTDDTGSGSDVYIADVPSGTTSHCTATGQTSGAVAYLTVSIT